MHETDIDCHTFQRRWNEQLDRRLPTSEDPLLTRHASNCPSCRELLVGESRLRMLLETPMGPPSPDFTHCVVAAAAKRISRSEELGYTRAKPERREPGFGKGGISFG